MLYHSILNISSRQNLELKVFETKQIFFSNAKKLKELFHDLIYFRLVLKNYDSHQLIKKVIHGQEVLKKYIF